MAFYANVSIEGDDADIAALIAALATATKNKLTKEGNTIRFDLATTATAANLATPIDALAAVTT